MGRKPAIGYFVVRGKGGFVGFIKPKSKSLSGPTFVNINEHMAGSCRTGFTPYRIESEEVMEDLWQTMRENMKSGIMKIANRWLDHPGPWTYEEAYAAATEEDERQNQINTTGNFGDEYKKPTNRDEKITREGSFGQNAQMKQLVKTTTKDDQLKEHNVQDNYRGNDDTPQCNIGVKEGIKTNEFLKIIPEEPQISKNMEEAGNEYNKENNKMKIINDQEQIPEVLTIEEDLVKKPKRGRPKGKSPGNKGKRAEDWHYKCDHCGKNGKAHKDDTLYGCEMCDEWTYGSCLPGIESIGEIWVCGKCNKTMIDMRSIKQDMLKITKQIEQLIKTMEDKYNGPEPKEPEINKEIQQHLQKNDEEIRQLSHEITTHKEYVKNLMDDLENTAKNRVK